MLSDQFDFVRPRARPITLGLVNCRQLILKLIEVICGNCRNAINNGSACSVLFLSTPGLFPAHRKTLEPSTASRAPKFFCVLEITLSCSKTALSTLNHCLLRYLSYCNSNINMPRHLKIECIPPPPQKIVNVLDSIKMWKRVVQNL